MKLLINTTLIYFETLHATEPLWDGWNEVIEICEKLGVQYFFSNSEGLVELKIYVQKVILDEIAMNELFAEVLTYFEFNLEYAALGGHGCDMALEITFKE